MKHEYSLDGLPVEVDVRGETVRGDDTVLSAIDDDLTRNHPWADVGYTIVPFLDASLVRALVDGIRARIFAAVRESLGDVVPADARLEDYHRYVTTDAAHHAAVGRLRLGWPSAEFPIDLDAVTRRVAEVVGAEVTSVNEAFGVDRWHVRVVRPGARDFNPLHRDVWLDRLRHAVNLYVPICASDERSAMPVVPGSHRWRESEIERTVSGATVDGLAYTVPAVVGSSLPLDLVRPRTPPGSMMLFSPYLIHGSGSNRNEDATRVSLEMRYWRCGGPTTPR